MNTKQRVLEALLGIGFSLGCAWLWFVPVFWDMAGTSEGMLAGLRQVFFSLDAHKRHLGSGIDFLGTVWIFSNVDQILSGDQTSVLPGIFYPTGFDLGVNTGFAWMDAVLSWPFIALMGMPASYNLHIILALTLTQAAAICMFRAARVPWAVPAPPGRGILRAGRLRCTRRANRGRHRQRDGE